MPGIRRYVSVDGGMSDNPRPALYEAKYEALVANKPERPARSRSPSPASTASATT